MHEAVQELDFDIVFVTSQKFDPELALSQLA